LKGQPVGEFDLIERYFQRPARALAAKAANGVHVGIGDDCALIQAAPGMQTAISTDMLVAGRHFFADADPRGLGHKALAVNLSDLAACGAVPLAFTLALSLPSVDEPWLAGFSAGLLALAIEHGCALVGGDTTQGPLNICITVIGEVPAGQALLRSGARAGDDIYVSGHLGDARLALDVLQDRQAVVGHWTTAAQASLLAACRGRLERPSPRIALGLALRGVANSAMDISDGLLGDLGHLLQASQVGAQVDVDIATSLIAACGHPSWGKHSISIEDWQIRRRTWALAGGDDYELLFTAPVQARAAVTAAAEATGTRVTRIGQIEAQPGLRLMDAQGRPVANTFASFDHFKSR
jgi:thiamine-monophosphate kinase